MKTEVSVKNIRMDAEEAYRKGDFFCSEAIMYSIRNNFELDVPEEVIAMASGFPVGIGKSKCTCGAVTGAIMALGLFFGRTSGADPKVNKTLELANELQQHFKDKNKVLCCSILTKGMDMGSGEHKEQCIRFTGEMAEKVSEIIIRENGYTNIDIV